MWSPRVLKEEKDILGLEHTDVPLKKDTVRGEGFICGFLDGNTNECLVYARRPFECALYPFVICGKQGRFFLGIDLNCPYAAEQYGKDIFELYVKDLFAALSCESARRLLKNNMHIAQDYPEVKEVRVLDI